MGASPNAISTHLPGKLWCFVLVLCCVCVVAFFRLKTLHSFFHHTMKVDRKSACLEAVVLELNVSDDESTAQCSRFALGKLAAQLEVPECLTCLKCRMIEFGAEDRMICVLGHPVWEATGAQQYQE